MKLESSNKIFGVVGFVFQLWFIILYAIDYRYFFVSSPTNTVEASLNFQDIQGFVMLVFLFLLFFLGNEIRLFRVHSCKHLRRRISLFKYVVFLYGNRLQHPILLHCQKFLARNWTCQR